MKKYYLYILLAIAITADGCKKEKNQTKDDASATVVGIWTLYSYTETTANGAKTVTSSQYPCMAEQKRIFNGDGTMVNIGTENTGFCNIGEFSGGPTSIAYQNVQGTWTLKGNQVEIIFKDKGSGAIWTSILSLSDVNGKKQLTFTSIYDSKTVTRVEIKN